jgi:hypothetical protein
MKKTINVDDVIETLNRMLEERPVVIGCLTSIMFPEPLGLHANTIVVKGVPEDYEDSESLLESVEEDPEEPAPEITKIGYNIVTLLNALFFEDGDHNTPIFTMLDEDGTVLRFVPRSDLIEHGILSDKKDSDDVEDLGDLEKSYLIN